MMKIEKSMTVSLKDILHSYKYNSRPRISMFQHTKQMSNPAFQSELLIFGLV